VHGPTAAFNIYKNRAFPTALPSFFNPFPTLRRSVARPHHALSTPPAWTHPESCFIGLAAAENHGGTAGVKPKSSIYHSGFDVPK